MRIAVQLARKRPAWATDVAELLRRWLATPQRTEAAGEAAVEAFLAALIGEEPVATLAGELLQSPTSSPSQVSLALRAVAQCGRVEPHASWIEPLRKQLASHDEPQVAAAVAAVANLAGDAFNGQLHEIADDPDRTPTLRMDALSALAMRAGKLDEATLARLIELFQHSGSPAAASRAAQTIGAARLTPSQLAQITPLLARASAMDLRELIRGFQVDLDPATATAFVDAIESADALTSLASHEFSDVIKRFPRPALARANAMLDRLMQHEQDKLRLLEALRDRLSSGDAERGRQLFASERARCSSCHRVGETGKAVGPDLTTIGANRSANDLLESIVFPSASIVRDYQPQQVLTVDGRALSGIVVRETAGAIELQQADGQTVALRREDIEWIRPGTVSIMPSGLDETLRESELLDVVVYLQNLR